MRHKLDAGLFIMFALLCIRDLSLYGQEQKEKSTKTQEAKIQVNPDSETGWVQKVFDIKYVNVSQLAGMLKIFPANITPNPSLRVIAVSCPAEVMGSIENTIKRIDIPSQNIEVTVYMLSASGKADESSNIPLEIQGAIKQLKGVFNYQSYRLLETAIVPCQNQRDTMVSGNISFPPPNPKTERYTLHVSASIVSDEKGRLIRLDSFVMKQRLGMPGTQFVEDSLLNTSINVREGQKVVVGKASFGNNSDALILVVTAKVLE